MSSDTVLFVLVAAYVGIVLGCLAYADSLADLRARLRTRRASRRYLTPAFGGLAVAVLVVAAVVGVRGLGSKAKVDPEEALGPRSAEPASLQPSRAFTPPAAVVRSKPPVRATPRPARRAARRPKVVSNLVSVSVRVTPPSTRTLSAPGPYSAGPAPLPAPPEGSAPRPLPAP